MFLSVNQVISNFVSYNVYLEHVHSDPVIKVWRVVEIRNFLDRNAVTLELENVCYTCTNISLLSI